MSYLTASEAARRVGLSEATIRKKIRLGRISASKNGSTWRIPITELDKVRAPSNTFEPPLPNTIEPESNAIERPSSPIHQEHDTFATEIAAAVEVLRAKLKAAEEIQGATRRELEASEHQAKSLRTDLNRTQDALANALESIRSLTDEIKGLTALVHTQRALPSPVGWLRGAIQQLTTLRM